ncbi:hypothetical protein GCM10028773_11300 [Spirosoma koreense]
MAQVKIGTNPTTIGANNNLEIEASTTGRKTSIDKTTGQVTIKDGTEGDGKILTSDANGASHWESATSAFRAKKTTSQTITAPANNNAFFAVVTNDTKPLDQDNLFNLATSRFVVQRPGTYIFSGNYVWNQTVATASSIAIFKNGVFLSNVGQGYAVGGPYGLSITAIDVAVIGDFYELRANVNVGSMTILSGEFTGTRVR